MKKDSIKIIVPKERIDHEKRVAASPETVEKLAGMGLEIIVEKGAGRESSILDSDFEAAGAISMSNPTEMFMNADIVLCVRRPLPKQIELMKTNAMIVGLLSPYDDPQGLEFMAKGGIVAFSLELLPRITRAQTMDALSSQSNIAGYRAVIDAAAVFNRAMPMMMTAAGTITPARVMVLGAGVAGLQAIATAKRLGAIVCASDVRAAVKEQVESLGATFIIIDNNAVEDTETAKGYAKEMNANFKKKQEEIIAETLRKQDIVICTALIPGRPAPLLISEEMIEQMRPGSVIVDLAVEKGGNCALSKCDEIVKAYGVTILGYANMPGRLAADASRLYARNLLNFITHLLDSENGRLKIDWEDEIIKETCVTRDGSVVHSALLTHLN